METLLDDRPYWHWSMERCQFFGYQLDIWVRGMVVGAPEKTVHYGVEFNHASPLIESADGARVHLCFRGVWTHLIVDEAAYSPDEAGFGVERRVFGSSRSSQLLTALGCLVGAGDGRSLFGYKLTHYQLRTSDAIVHVFSPFAPTVAAD